MRMMMQVQIPNDDFNDAVADGEAGELIGRILEDIGPEAVYFTAIDGRRAAVLIVDLEDSSQIPAVAEPWFLTFDAEIEFYPVMSPEDLARAGLDDLGDRWG